MVGARFTKTYETILCGNFEVVPISARSRMTQYTFDLMCTIKGMFPSYTRAPSYSAYSWYHFAWLISSQAFVAVIARSLLIWKLSIAPKIQSMQTNKNFVEGKYCRQRVESIFQKFSSKLTHRALEMLRSIKVKIYLDDLWMVDACNRTSLSIQVVWVRWITHNPSLFGIFTPTQCVSKWIGGSSKCVFTALLWLFKDCDNGCNRLQLPSYILNCIRFVQCPPPKHNDEYVDNDSLWPMASLLQKCCCYQFTNELWPLACIQQFYYR